MIATRTTTKIFSKAGILASIALLATVSAGVHPSSSDAYSIERLQNVAKLGDFVVGPGKQELLMNPGESRIVNLVVTNRTGEVKIFEIGFEDIAGSENPEETVKLLGNESGKQSLKNFLSVAERTFALQHGEQAIVPVTVSIPLESEPGGKYGSVVVSTQAIGEMNAGAGAKVVSRIATLFLIEVAGDVEKEGELVSFETVGKKVVFGEGPIDFRLLFRNSGNVHLDPHGTIAVANIFGGSVANIALDPWFALPDSLRSREVRWSETPAWGIYTATASIYPGFGETFETRKLTIVMLPWKNVAIVMLALLALGVLWKVFGKKFEVKRRS